MGTCSCFPKAEAVGTSAQKIPGEADKLVSISQFHTNRRMKSMKLSLNLKVRMKNVLLVWFFEVQRFGPRASGMLDKCSTTVLHPQPLTIGIS